MNNDNTRSRTMARISLLPIQVEESGNIPDMDRIWIKGWFPILFELSCIVSRYNILVVHKEVKLVKFTRCKLDDFNTLFIFEISKYYNHREIEIKLRY